VLWLSDAAGANLPAATGTAPVWRVRNKSDIRGNGAVPSDGIRTFDISARRGDGVPDLVDALVAFAQETFGGGEPALISRARHRDLLEQCVAALDRALTAENAGIEVIAEELRGAIHALGRLTGRIDVEDLLDVIFREFCIGK